MSIERTEALLDKLRVDRARAVRRAGGDESNLGAAAAAVASLDEQIALAERLLQRAREDEERDPGIYGGGIEVPYDGPIRPL
ncbi:hypothetical protein AB0O70_05525 [Microbacterium paraoxydans]|uniref:hypothetical protein n=1 Tax=Microbacterium paraoxydans TaxID=199592 RepID=UPI003424A542